MVWFGHLRWRVSKHRWPNYDRVERNRDIRHCLQHHFDRSHVASLLRTVEYQEVQDIKATAYNTLKKGASAASRKMSHEQSLTKQRTLTPINLSWLYLSQILYHDEIRTLKQYPHVETTNENEAIENKTPLLQNSLPPLRLV